MTAVLIGLPLMAVTGTAMADPVHHDGDQRQSYQQDRHDGERHDGERHDGERHDGERNRGNWNQGEVNPGNRDQGNGWQAPQLPQFPPLPGGLDFGS